MNTYTLPKRLVNQALREADEELRALHRAGIFGDSDPNHPKFNGGINYATGKPLTLFGHNPDALMARQYK